MNLCSDLSEARKERGISQSELAARVGVPRLAITRLEHSTGSVPLLVKVMRELDFRVAGVARGGTLPDQLRARRERLKWPVSRVAEKTGLDTRTIEAVERGGGTVASLAKMLNVVAPNAKRSEPPRASWAYDASNEERDQRFTPRSFFDRVVAAFGPIDLDPCGHALSAVEARRKIILPECGLASSWASNRTVFINPPYSSVSQWMARACDAMENGEVETIVMLVPARTDSDVYQRRVSRDADTIFLAGRIRFESAKGLAWPAPFSLMTVIWGGTDDQISRFIEQVPAVRMRPWNKAL